MRTGSAYLASLRDDRHVVVDGSRVDDVTEHPGFRGIARTMARLFDHAADSENGMQIHDNELGVNVNAAFATPRSMEDLERRRAAITSWANLTGGFVGRSPDHVAGFIAGFAAAPAVFDRGQHRFGVNVTRFYRRLLAENLFLSYVIIPPQGSGPAGEVEQVHLVGETDDGIVVRGVQILGTSAAVSDYIFVSCIRPLGSDESDKALSFVVPMAAPGLRVHCRRPYAEGAPSVFDYPLSTRFDESDGMVLFDDVHVPWEDVFVCGDPTAVREQFFKTPAHVLGNSQAQIRFTVKLKFLIGLARRLSETNGTDAIPSVQEKLGELASLAAAIEAMAIAAEATATVDDHGVAVPNPRFVYGPMGLQAEHYPRVIQLLRELAGSSVLQVPASFRDLAHPDSRVYGGELVEERTKLYKLIWDAVSSEFAGRHTQYEMFYAGAPHIARGYAFRNYGYDEPLALVDAISEHWALETAEVGA